MYVDRPTLLSRVTDLILFSVEPTRQGGLNHFVSHGDISALSRARTGMASPPRVLLCVGGAGRSTEFRHIVQDPKLRKALVKSIAKVVKQHNLDGVDFDWEVPGPGDLVAYAQLLTDCKKKLKKKQVTVTVHPGQEMGPPQGTTGEPALSLAADRVHLMAYDMITKQERRHSTYEMSALAVDSLSRSRVPANKIVLGLPAYGRHTTNPGEVKTYSEIVDVRCRAMLSLSLLAALQPFTRAGRGGGLRI